MKLRRRTPSRQEASTALSGSPAAPARAAVRLVPPLDAAWLLLESQDTPMHVGCLQVFSPPRGQRRGYALKLLQHLRETTGLAPPFSLKLRHPGIAGVLPAWIEDPAPDMSHHVRHLGLPAPGGELELGSVIASLQGTALDLTRPLWECYLIEGLARGRIALFTKIHHSLMDGIGGMRLLQAALSPDPLRRDLPPPWAQPRPARNAAAAPDASTPSLSQRLLAPLRAAPDAAQALASLLRAALPGAHSHLSAPYTAPPTMFNGRTSIQRRLATAQLPLARIHALAHRAGVTVNDVFLALCAAALRRYLLERKALPPRPLVAGVPVSVRPPGDARVGTAISFILASLATDIADPAARLQHIHAATCAAKDHLHRMAPGALTEYTLLLMTPYMLELMSGIGGHGPPVFNLAISNVPGFDRPLYYNGARLEAMYPMSILTHGQSLNITTVSYDGQLDVGVTACRRAVPHVQRIARYLHDALDELDPAAPAPRPRRKRSATA